MGKINKVTEHSSTPFLHHVGEFHQQRLQQHCSQAAPTISNIRQSFTERRTLIYAQRLIHIRANGAVPLEIVGGSVVYYSSCATTKRNKEDNREAEFMHTKECVQNYRHIYDAFYLFLSLSHV